jgi:hypothetical protein
LSNEHDKNLIETIEDFLEEILPDENEDNLIKEEVWKDLSHIYYKYDSSRQKRAFREVMLEISKEVSQDNWSHIYQKIYHIEKKNNRY